LPECTKTRDLGLWFEKCFYTRPASPCKIFGALVTAGLFESDFAIDFSKHSNVQFICNLNAPDKAARCI